MDRDELLDKVHTERRQLDRYLFEFERDESGSFVSSDRLKFGQEEMLEPNVVGEWCLKDLLAHLIDCEQRLIAWFEAPLMDEAPSTPAPCGDPDALSKTEADIPHGLRTMPPDGVLSLFPWSFQRVVATIQSMSSEDLFTADRYAWTGGTTLAERVAWSTYRRYDWAKALIRRWRTTHPGAYLNKMIVLERIEREHGRLEKSVAQLSESQMERPGVVGEWSVKDVLAHLTDWEQRFLGWYTAGRRGEVPETPAPGLTWGDLDFLNRQIFEAHRDSALSDVAAEFQRSYRQMHDSVQEMPEEEMFEVGRYDWLGEANLVDCILPNTANHYRWAKDHIRAWMAEQGI
jgi:hypothetical protein